MCGIGNVRNWPITRNSGDGKHVKATGVKTKLRCKKGDWRGELLKIRGRSRSVTEK
jgi:hypothetical protein